MLNQELWLIEPTNN